MLKEGSEFYWYSGFSRLVLPFDLEECIGSIDVRDARQMWVLSLYPHHNITPELKKFLFALVYVRHGSIIEEE